MKANIVIGLQFGDEGKGKTISWLTENHKNKKQIVVRFSGGQQAGHTVIHDGVKHIFSNFGSGCLHDIETYYTQHCTIYPVTLENESKVLYSKTNKHHNIIVHPLTMITTPYDIIYNRVNEMKNRHGSVGLGVGATMKRNIETPYKLYAIDILHRGLFMEKLKQISRYYSNLLGGLEFSNLCVSKLGDINFKYEIDRFYSLFDKNIMINDYSMLQDYDVINFEGSQGVLLDMDHGIFPNVTYGNTTSKNAMEICKRLNIDNINMYYITRCYQTRHGNGWMSSENPNITLVNNENEINVQNDWQGNFRIGDFDIKLVNQAYLIDKIYSENRTVDNLVITCIDQIPDFNMNLEIFYNHMRLKNIYKSFSPNTKDIQMIIN